MKAKMLFALVLLILNLTPIYSQQILEANVVAELEYGSSGNVYFLYEASNSDYYKSVVTGVELENNELVRIWTPANDDSLFLVQDLSDEQFYARKIDNLNSQLPEELTLLLPSLDNEILFFENPSHLAQLYQITEDQAYENDSTFQVFLDGIEELYGQSFISYRNYFNGKYPISGIYRDDEIDQMEQENFISDDILNTYFNQYRLMGFGDSVYYYHNRQEILAVHKNNESGIDYLKSLARIKDDNIDLDILTGVSAVDLDQKEISFISKKGKIGVLKGIVYNQVPGGADWFHQTTPHLIETVGNCLPNRKGLTVETWYGISPTGPQPSEQYNYYTDLFAVTSQGDYILRTVTLKINWGDGSPIQVVNNYTDLDVIYHDYPAGVETTYPVSIETVLEDAYTGQLFSIFDGDGYPLSQDYEFEVNIACSDDDVQMWKEKVNSAGSWKMKMSGWTTNNIFGNHIGGYTHAYKKQNNGSWKLDKADIKIEVEGTFRHQSDCYTTDYKWGNKQHNNDKKIQKTKAKVFTRYQKFANGDVRTKHRMIKWGVTLYDEIILNPCP